MVQRKTSAKSAGKSSSRARTRKQPEALMMLKQDHEHVAHLFQEFEDADNPQEKQEIAQLICSELTVHAELEEELFYPEVQKAIKDPDLIEEARVEHASLKQLIGDIQSKRPGEPQFDATVKVLSEYVKHHVQEEEQKLFREVMRADLDLNAMAERMRERKAELMDEEGLTEEDIEQHS